MKGQLPQPLSAYEFGAVAEIRDPVLMEYLGSFHEEYPISVQHRQLFRQLGSECVYARPIQNGRWNNDCWLILLRFGSVLEGRFGFTREVPVLYYPFNDLQIRQVDGIETHLANLPMDRRSVSSSEVFIWSNDDRLIEKLDHWSSPTRVLIPLPNQEDMSGNDPISHFINTLAKKLTSRDLYSIRSYVTGEQFFGRAAELQFVNDCIRSREVVGVFGLRKTGKTSLLHEAIRANRPTYNSSNPIEIIIYQDLEHLPSVADDPVPELIYDVSDKLRSALKELKFPAFEFSETSVDTSLSKFRRSLDLLLTKIEGEASITIVLDEIEYLCPPNPIGDTSTEPFQKVRQLFGVFRKLVQERENFGLVLAGLSSSSIEDSQLYGSPNPLFSFAIARYLGPFSLLEADQMLNTVGKRVGLDWSVGAIELAHELSGGHVLLLRELASAVLGNQRQTRTTAVNIKRAHVSAVVPTWRERVASHVKEVLPHLRRYYNEEADLAIMLIEDPRSFGDYASLYPANVKRLRELGIVTLNADGTFTPSKMLEFSYEFEQRPDPKNSLASIPTSPGDRPIDLLISSEEDMSLEKKETLLSHVSEIPDEAISDEVIRACLGFLNHRGGTVLVGVSDSNDVVGIERDIIKRKSTDRLALYLNSQIRNKIGQDAVGLISVSFPNLHQGETVLRIDVSPSDRPIFSSTLVGKRTGLFVRNNNSTSLLNDQEAHNYIVRHWPGQK